MSNEEKIRIIKKSNTHEAVKCRVKDLLSFDCISEGYTEEEDRMFIEEALAENEEEFKGMETEIKNLGGPSTEDIYRLEFSEGYINQVLFEAMEEFISYEGRKSFKELLTPRKITKEEGERIMEDFQRDYEEKFYDAMEEKYLLEETLSN